MKIALFVVVGLVAVAVVGSVFWLAYMNRGSEKVLTALLTAVFTLGGLPAAIFIILVLGTEPPISEVFPVAFQYDVKTKLPPPLPWTLISHRFLPSFILLNSLHKTHPELFSDQNKQNEGDVSQPITLYHHLLQRSLIEWMGERGGWQARRLRFDLPIARQESSEPMPGATGHSTTLQEPELRTALAGNWFRDTWVHAGASRLMLPPDTTLSISAPSAEPGQLADIRLANSFCQVSIHTSQHMWLRSLGMYRFLAGIPEDVSHQIATPVYEVRIVATFSRLRGGHPDMPKYRAWVRELADGLRDKFDEQLIWKRTREDFVFRKQFGIGENDGI